MSQIWDGVNGRDTFSWLYNSFFFVFIKTKLKCNQCCGHVMMVVVVTIPGVYLVHTRQTNILSEIIKGGFLLITKMIQQQIQTTRKRMSGQIADWVVFPFPLEFYYPE